MRWAHSAAQMQRHYTRTLRKAIGVPSDDRYAATGVVSRSSRRSAARAEVAGRPPTPSPLCRSKASGPTLSPIPGDSACETGASRAPKPPSGQHQLRRDIQHEPMLRAVDRGQRAVPRPGGARLVGCARCPRLFIVAADDAVRTDVLHPTTALHAVFAQHVLRALSTTFVGR
jgi:hypothetical protein